MKKSITLFSVGVLSIGLMAFGFNNWNSTTSEKATDVSNGVKVESNYYLKSSGRYADVKEFFYDMGTRFRPIKKSITQNALSIEDIVDQSDIDLVEKYKSISVIVIKNDVQTAEQEIGFSDQLTQGQMKLLRSMDYSSNFLIRADFVAKDKKTPLHAQYFSPHLTVVPEKQAEYKQGKKALLNYLSFQNQKNTSFIDEHKLQPAKLYFTVTKSGAIKNVTLDRSCNFTHIDIALIELITNSTGNWIPAENAQGEKVDQELVLFFGMQGC